MTEPRYPEVTRGHTEVSIAVEEGSWTRVIRLAKAEASLLHARLGEVLGAPAPAPSEARLRTALEEIERIDLAYPGDEAASLRMAQVIARAALAEPEGPGGEEGRDG